MNFDFYDAMWQRRHQNDAGADVLDELSRSLFGAARENRDPEISIEIAWRRARCQHFAGMIALDAKRFSVAQSKFAEGATLILQKNSGVASQFWWAVNAIEAARLQSQLATLRVLPAVKTQLQSALRDDETFHFAGPHRVLGRIFHLAPRVLGGDFGKSELHFRRALEIADNSTTRCYFGEFLISQNRNDEAKAQFEAILAAPIDENWRWEQARDRVLAARNLWKWKAKAASFVSE